MVTPSTYRAPRRPAPARRPEALRRTQAAAIREESGSALSAVLVLIALVGALAGVVLLAQLAQHRFIRRDVHRLQAYYAAEAGLFRALAKLSERPSWQATEESFPCAERARCRVSAAPYGGYVYLVSEASVGGQARRLHALAGRQASGLLEGAVVTGDTGSDLLLTGGAEVTGTVHMGPGRVRGEPLGRGGGGEGVLRGEVRQTPGFTIPPLQGETLRRTARRLGAHLDTPPAEALGAEAARRQARRRRAATGDEDDPGAGRPLALFARGDLTLTAADSLLARGPLVAIATGTLTVRGPFRAPPGARLVAGDTLVVEGAAQLPRALLYAGEEVRITGEARGAMQVLAGRRAFVGGAAHLTYPSVVYAQGQALRASATEDSATDASAPGDSASNASSLESRPPGPSPAPSGVELAGQAVVDGTLLFAPKAASRADSVREGGGQGRAGRIVVGRGATLRGALYSATRAEPHGRIDGTALARAFSFYRSPTNYVGWIDGAHVDPGRRPAGYVAPIGLETEGPLALIRLGALPEDEAPLAAP